MTFPGRKPEERCRLEKKLTLKKPSYHFHHLADADKSKMTVNEMPIQMLLIKSGMSLNVPVCLC